MMMMQPIDGSKQDPNMVIQQQPAMYATASAMQPVVYMPQPQGAQPMVATLPNGQQQVVYMAQPYGNGMQQPQVVYASGAPAPLPAYYSAPPQGAVALQQPVATSSSPPPTKEPEITIEPVQSSTDDDGDKKESNAGTSSKPSKKPTNTSNATSSKPSKNVSVLGLMGSVTSTANNLQQKQKTYKSSFFQMKKSLFALFESVAFVGKACGLDFRI